LLLKANAIIGLGEIAIGLGKEFLPFVEQVMKRFVECSSVTVDRLDDDAVDGLILVRESLLETFQHIIQLLGEIYSVMFRKYWGFLFEFIQTLWNDTEIRTSTIVSTILGIIG
jgi:hypothetical protein